MAPTHMPPQMVPREIETQVAGTSTAYGKSCLECVRSKCKCNTLGIGLACERCHKLNKSCQPAERIRKKKTPRPVGSRTKQIEKKLDDLVQMLRNGERPGPVVLPQDSNPATFLVGEAPCQMSSATVDFCETQQTNQLSSIPASISLPDPALPSPFEAEAYLQSFLTKKLPNLPFLYIPLTTTSQKLLSEKPFLWHCIMCLSSQHTKQMTALNKKVREILSSRMLVQAEYDIDLLLGLLVFISWANCLLLKKPALSMFAQLAISLVCDLGLNKPIAEPMPNFSVYGYPEPSSLRTMEERRAVLGTFLVSSITSTFLKRIDALRWTSHMEECLNVLAESKECPGDAVLVQQVRLQLLVEQASQISQQIRESGNATPLDLYRRSLQGQLQEVNDKLSPELNFNPIILLHTHSTALSIAELGLSPTPSTSTSATDISRLESLFATLEAVNSWFTTALSIPPSAHSGFPFTIYAQLTHSIISLYKLSSPSSLSLSWDVGYVRSTADIIGYLSRIVANMRSVGGVEGVSEPERLVWGWAAEGLERTRVRWEGKLAEVKVVGGEVGMGEFASDEAWFLNAFNGGDWVW